jgi:hypothetical protein
MTDGDSSNLNRGSLSERRPQSSLELDRRRIPGDAQLTGLVCAFIERNPPEALQIVRPTQSPVRHLAQELKCEPPCFDTMIVYAARKLDQYAARKVGHLRGGYSTLNATAIGILLS